MARRLERSRGGPIQKCCQKTTTTSRRKTSTPRTTTALTIPRLPKRLFPTVSGTASLKRWSGGDML
ncbi:MAG: hypothetical protein E6K86_00225 [Thaumarchaeota archaeon]|nr:MAG: hypothetical protein E6K86_00225 [Nitrososphaerota archaeon]